jgi:hypothetical protein
MRRKFPDTRSELYLCKDCANWKESEDPEYTSSCVDRNSEYTDFVYGKRKFTREASVVTIRSGRGKWPCRFKSRYNK